MPRFDAEKYRSLHRRRGEPFLWDKSFECGCPDIRQCDVCDKDGQAYVRQTVDSATRILIHDTVSDMQEREFGLIPAGQTPFSVMPDEAYIGRLDRITLPSRERIMQQEVVRGNTATDSLLYAPVTINDVRQGDTTFTEYELTATGIEWVGDAPAEGEKYAIEYTYRPVFVFLGDNDRMPRPDKNGVLMPQRGLLMIYRP
jgi:hypothetical protein